MSVANAIESMTLILPRPSVCSAHGRGRAAEEADAIAYRSDVAKAAATWLGSAPPPRWTKAMAEVVFIGGTRLGEVTMRRAVSLILDGLKAAGVYTGTCEMPDPPRMTAPPTSGAAKRQYLIFGGPHVRVIATGLDP